MNFTNRNKDETEQVSQMLMSDAVQSAVLNAIDQNLDLDESDDLEKVKNGIRQSLRSIGIQNSTQNKN